GKREEKVSLQTRDPVEAKRCHAEALAQIEMRWANLRAGPKSLREREAHQLAIAAHDRWLEQYRDNPSQQTIWDVELGDRVFSRPKPETSGDYEYLYGSSILVLDRPTRARRQPGMPAASRCSRSTAITACSSRLRMRAPTCSAATLGQPSIRLGG